MESPPPAPPADAAKACMSNRKWRFDCQESEDRRLCTLCIALPIHQGHRSAWSDVSETPLKIYICRKLSDSCQDKKQVMCLCVCVCFLLIFSVAVCESECVMSSTETCSVFCWKIVNCTRNFLLIMQSAICASDHVSSSSLEAICCTLSTVRVRVTGQWGWVRGPGRFGPHRAWIFINFHNLCAGCEHCNNLSRSGCCPFAFMAARLFKY